MTARKDVPSGTLDMLALRVIARGPIHGWGLMKRLGELTDNVFQVTPGGLFPALQRLEEEQVEFRNFLDRLRHAKDKEEFDAFMAQHRNRPTPPNEPPPQN